MHGSITACIAEFEGLKEELERLLVKNRGLTRASPQQTAAPRNSSVSSQQPHAQDTLDWPPSRSSSSHSQSSSCSSFCREPLGQTNRQTAQPTSAAEHASQQLNSDIDILLKQVDTVMAAPVLQLPAWFTNTPGSPSCTVTETPQTGPAPAYSHSAQNAHRVVTPKLKASSLSSGSSHTRSQHIEAVASTATSAAKIQKAAALPQKSTQSKSSRSTMSAAQDSEACVDSIPAASALLASKPDNLSILRVACSITPSQSEDTATSIKSSHHACIDTFSSPRQWLTNDMADSASSVSSTADSIKPAGASAAAAVALHAVTVLADAEASGSQKVGSLRRSASQDSSEPASHGSGTISSTHCLLGLAQPDDYFPDSIHGADSQPEQDPDHVQMENIAPGWHRQPLQSLTKGIGTSVKLADIASNGIDDTASTSLGQGGLLEGYLRGSSAKLQLPASVRTGSRKSALSVRTPLKTITEVQTASLIHAPLLLVSECQSAATHTLQVAKMLQ